MLSTVLACQKNKRPFEYLSFDADGVAYYYPKGVVSYKGSGQNYEFDALGAKPINIDTNNNIKYIIYGSDKNMPIGICGTVQLQFPDQNIPTEDTVMIDGVHATASILYFKQSYNNYHANGGTQGAGRIIFTKRTPARLEGTFEFTAIHNVNGSTINITNGKFSIIPTL